MKHKWPKGSDAIGLCTICGQIRRPSPDPGRTAICCADFVREVARANLEAMERHTQRSVEWLRSQGFVVTEPRP